MSLYSFRLDEIHVKYQRGKIDDTDVVTFGVNINQVDSGHATGEFYGHSGFTVPAHAVYPNNTLNMTKPWEIGPFEIADIDSVTVVYSGTNISDLQLSSLRSKEQDEIELRILDAAMVGAVGALTGGLLGELIGSALGAITDPIGKLLGYKQYGPCNGVVFTDKVEFNGGGLGHLDFSPSLLPNEYSARSFTRSYTDEATHDSSICGHIAETDVTFSVLRVLNISVKAMMQSRYPQASLSEGLRKLGPGTAFSIKSLLGVIP